MTADQTVFKSNGKGKGHHAFFVLVIFFISWMSLTNSFDVEVWIIWRSLKFGEG